MIYRIALTMIPQVGSVHARSLIQAFSCAREIFSAPKRLLEKLEGIGSIRAGNIKTFQNFHECEKEMRFMDKHGIVAYFITDTNYPKRLLHCYDAPVLFYYKGTADLNTTRVLSVVGTRNPSTYGREQCECLIEGMPGDVLIISGLASGIDTFAHRAALNNGHNTVGILAHGFQTIYPRHNAHLAAQMTRSGGLITEFMSSIQPDRENFPERNRIVAGISDCTVVVETGPKGGSMITARLANEYNREVFAFPGRANDAKSEGCNLLIKNNRAQLITSAKDLLEFMNWNEKIKKESPVQPQLFYDLDETEKQLASILQHGQKHIDELMMFGIPAGRLASSLLSLELHGCVESLPGKRYRWKG